MSDEALIAKRLDVTGLWAGGGVRVLVTRWSRHRHPSESESQTTVATVEFMRSRTFRKRVGRTVMVADPNTIIFFRPGETFRIEHPCGQENSATLLRIEPPLWDEILEDAKGRLALQGSCPVSKTGNHSSAAVHLLQHRLVTYLSSPTIEPLVAQDAALRLLRAVFGAAAFAEYEPQNSIHRGSSVDRVWAAKEFLNRHVSDRLRLDDVAEAAGCSPWHLSRLFSQHVGLPIHQYLKRLRVRQALAEISEGCRDLSRLALQTGFDSHSHFSAAFRQEFGLPPSRVRASAGLSGAFNDL